MDAHLGSSSPFDSVFEIGQQIYTDITFGVRKTLSSMKGMDKVFKVACEALLLLTYQREISSLLIVLAKLKNFRDLTRVFRILDHLKMWICPEKNNLPFWLDSKTSWLKIGSKGLSTCVEICTVIKFLEMISLIPVINSVGFISLNIVKNTFEMIGSLLACMDHCLELNNLNEINHKQLLREIKWEHRKKQIECILGKCPGYEVQMMDLKRFYESKIHSTQLKIKKVELRHLFLGIDSGPSLLKKEERDFLCDANEQLILLLEKSKELVMDTLLVDTSFLEREFQQKILQWREKLWIFLDQVDEFQKATKYAESSESTSCLQLDLTSAAIKLLDISESHLSIFHGMREAHSSKLREFDRQELEELVNQKKLWASFANNIADKPINVSGNIYQKFCIGKIDRIQEKKAKTHAERIFATSSMAIRVGKIALAVLRLAVIVWACLTVIQPVIISISLSTYLLSYIKYLSSPDRNLQTSSQSVEIC